MIWRILKVKRQPIVNDIIFQIIDENGYLHAEHYWGTDSLDRFIENLFKYKICSKITMEKIYLPPEEEQVT